MRHLFITGVSKGLGQSIAHRLQSDTSRIVGFSRTPGDFKGEFHPCDLSNPIEASTVIRDALAEAPLKIGDEIVFISNAGQLGPLDFLRTLEPKDIQENLTSNIIGAAVALQRFLERVRDIDAPKLFLQISSGAALPERVKPGWSLYCASKAGQEQLVRTAAIEQTHEAHPSMILNLNPGLMETNMQEIIRSASPEAFPDVDAFIAFKKDGRVPSPDTVADAIATLIERFPSLENGATYQTAAFQ